MSSENLPPDETAAVNRAVIEAVYHVESFFIDAAKEYDFAFRRDV